MMQKSFVKFAYKNDINVNLYFTLISLKAKEVGINEERVQNLQNQ